MWGLLHLVTEAAFMVSGRSFRGGTGPGGGPDYQYGLQGTTTGHPSSGGARSCQLHAVSRSVHGSSGHAHW